MLYFAFCVFCLVAAFGVMCSAIEYKNIPN